MRRAINASVHAAVGIMEFTDKERCNMNLNEAMGKLRAAGTGSVAMHVNIWDHRNDYGTIVTYQGCILGDNLPGSCVIFEADTIDAAVAGVLAQLPTEPTGAPDQAIAAIESDIAGIEGAK
jgi:hypothetical protein